ncbi:M48 family metallopeptidase [Sphingomonas sp. BK580]|uniref:M48 family metallopeptidase n=1 Tax=Sphingomonas sp. BK580 TaxID=2586972 RepID=UPI001620B9EF|nr:M48 family metallopeptidase [Sphingomonas sp. BK580]MBB3693058.1 putative Zn-dependent protease [Sphingomonas sp. BK580]
MSRPIVRVALAIAALCLPVEAVAARAADLTLPPFVSAYQPSTAAERGIWMQADEDERQLRDSHLLIDDAALNAYVRHVLCRTVGGERCHAVRLYVLRIPAMNATTHPNGAISVWSGLLLRVRDEAELGAVLGHEFAHFEQRHMLALQHRKLGASDLVAWTALFAGGAAPLVRLITAASTYSFSRAQESEADSLGLRFVAAAGYDPRRVAEVWARQMDEADARAAGRKQRSRRYDGVHLLSTHPTDLQRMTALRAAAATLPAGGVTEAAAYAAALRPWRAAFLADQIKLNDFGGTDYLLGRLAQDGWSEDLLFARAELYRQRGNPRDLVAAADFYRQALALDQRHAESHRGLGMALLRGGETESGRAELRRYLELAPAAGDAAMVRALVS